MQLMLSSIQSTCSSVHLLFLLELFLTLASKISYQPLTRESILRRHPPSHNSIQECLSLASVEAQYLKSTHTQMLLAGCTIETNMISNALALLANPIHRVYLTLRVN